MTNPIHDQGEQYGVRMQNRRKGQVWDHSNKTFIVLQLTAALVSWLIYRAAAHDLGPAGTAFVLMQVCAVVGSLWANRLRRKMTPGVARLFN